MDNIEWPTDAGTWADSWQTLSWGRRAIDGDGRSLLLLLLLVSWSACRAAIGAASAGCDGRTVSVRDQRRPYAFECARSLRTGKMGICCILEGEEEGRILN